jgi:hypothetical protein
MDPDRNNWNIYEELAIENLDGGFEPILNYTQEDYKRRLKSLTERIILLDTSVIYSDDIYSFDVDAICGIDFKILGSTNKVYNVQVWRELDKVGCACSCMDFVMRNRHCKHIYWIGSKHFDEIDPKLWSLWDYKKVVTECWIVHENRTFKNARNHNCPICLDFIDYENDMTICCKNECQNAVHAICWTRFYNISGKSNCVVCRTDIMPDIIEYQILY